MNVYLTECFCSALIETHQPTQIFLRIQCNLHVVDIRYTIEIIKTTLLIIQIKDWLRAFFLFRNKLCFGSDPIKYYW